jgi:CTP synthase (UTP-ammonia lyase)
MTQQQKIRIALVGDFDPSVPAHQAIPVALDRVANDTGLSVQATWCRRRMFGMAQVCRRSMASGACRPVLIATWTAR